MLVCWNTPRKVVAYSTSVAASGVMSTTTVSATPDSAVQPIMSSGLNQNAPKLSRRSAL
jgi:hypothetical protein